MQSGMNWEQILEQLKDDDVVLMRNGRAVALLSNFDDDEMYWYLQEHDKDFLDSIARAREQVAKGESLGHDQLKRDLGID